MDAWCLQVTRRVPLTCTLTGLRDSSAVHSVTLMAAPGSPVIFTFGGLQPATRYRISIIAPPAMEGPRGWVMTLPTEPQVGYIGHEADAELYCIA